MMCPYSDLISVWLQVGGGMAGMLIVEDDPLVTPTALLFMQVTFFTFVQYFKP